MNKLIKITEYKFNYLLKKFNKTNNKINQRRARVISVELRKLLKDFRKKSLKNK